MKSTLTAGTPLPRTRRDWKPFFVDSAIGLLGFAVLVKVNLIGELFLTELGLALLLPYLLLRSEPEPATDRTQRFVLTLGSFWLLSQLLSDMVQGTEFHDWTRGVSKIAFVLLNYVALRRLLNTERRLLSFAVGFALGSAVRLYLDGFESDTLWKFGLGTSTSILLLVLASSTGLRRYPWSVVVIMFGVAAFSTLQNTRNMAGVAAISGSMMAIGLLLHSQLHASFSARVIATLTLMVLGIGAYVTIGELSAHGYLGEKAKEKYEKQVKRGEGSLLLGGRAEWRASLMAIEDSPIIGHGSWAKNAEYANTYRSRLRAESGEQFQTATSQDLIPTHSFIMGAWVEAGVLGAVFWSGVLFVVLSSLFSLLTWRLPLGPLAIFFATLMLWDIPFSPFGGERRLQIAMVLVLLPIAATHARGKTLPRTLRALSTSGRATPQA